MAQPEVTESVPLLQESDDGNKIFERKIAGTNILEGIINFTKKAALVGIIYISGYMNWSIAWFIGPLVLLVIRQQNKKDKALRLNIAKSAAISNEKDVVLARLDDLPAWVFFPDIERAEWINRIIKQCWPNVNHYARDLLRDSIQPNLATSLEKMKLYGFKFERIILGEIPPRVGGVKVYEKVVARNEIIMDLDIFYAGNCDINFTVSGMKGGIKDLQVHGMVRVVMKPLLKTMPLVGGLQVFFLNNPTIDFNLVGIIDLFDIPGLSDLIRQVVIEQVASMMVLPNKFPIKLSDAIDTEELKMPEPEGVLRVHVIEAKDLMKKDITLLGKGKSDPYAVLFVGAQEFKTKTIMNTVDPKWDYWCEFVVLESNAQQFEVQVWDLDDAKADEKLGRTNNIYKRKFTVDVARQSQLLIRLFDKDKGSFDEKLGRATVEIANIAKKGKEDVWLTLEDAKRGMVHLRLSWLHLSSDYSDLKYALEETQMLQVTYMSTAILTVYIDSAKNLPQARISSLPDPFVEVSIGNHVMQTEVQMRTDAPVWEKGFTFLIANPESDTLHFLIKDRKTEKDLGTFEYNLTTIATRPKLEIRKQPFSLKHSGPDSKIILAMNLRILKCNSTLDDDASFLSRQMSIKSNTSTTGSPKSRSEFVIPDESVISSNSSENRDHSVEKETAQKIIAPALASENVRHRSSSLASTAGEAGLGRIQLSFQYSVQRQRLAIEVHKVMNLPLKDPSNIPDPYVKLYLLPGRSKDSKRKTEVIKDNCNPTFDETFEYVISQGELNHLQLEVTVCTQKQLFSSNFMGQVVVDFALINLASAFTGWFDLKPAQD